MPDRDPAKLRAWQDRSRRPLPRRSPKAQARRDRARTELVGAPDSKFRGVGIPDEVRLEVADRSGGYCEVRFAGCLGDAHNMHHRKRRGQGGPDTAANLVDVCHRCHHHGIHGEGNARYDLAEIRAVGLLIRATDPDPTVAYSAA